MSQETDNTQEVVNDNTTTEATKPTEEIKHYEYAHLTMFCGKCNAKYIIDENVKGGIRINLPTTSTAQITLVCKDCNNTMGLFYVESAKKDDVKEENNGDVAETVSEESTNIDVQTESTEQ